LQYVALYAPCSDRGLILEFLHKFITFSYTVHLLGIHGNTTLEVTVLMARVFLAHTWLIPSLNELKLGNKHGKRLGGYGANHNLVEKPT
jgi:hypothetical protein